jgi:hypothetical protein
MLHGVVLFGDLRGFFLQSLDMQLIRLALVLGVILGLPECGDNGFSLSHPIRIHPFKVIGVNDEGFVFLLKAIEFGSRHQAFLHDSVIGALPDAADGTVQNRQGDAEYNKTLAACPECWPTDTHVSQ